MKDDRSILHIMEEQGQAAPRVQLEGTERDLGDTDATQRYEITGEIARGGVGIVHRGRDNDVGRDVAIKVLLIEHLSDPELVQRFVEEAQIGGQLQHPGIVPVYELGLQSDKRPFFAMKLVKGETLSAKLTRRSDPAEGRHDLLAIFREVCRTLAYAHARGVIHRDLKPSNIMSGNFGEVQVVDWGFAKVLRKGGVHDERLAKKAERSTSMISTVRSGNADAESIAGSVMGTPAYMPPEQARGHVEDLDDRSDIFSLGAILAEILTGVAPYTGTGDERMAAAAKAEVGPALERLDACGADESLVSLAKGCLEPLPKDRPASAQAMADTIATYLTSAESRAHRSQVKALKAEALAEQQRRARRQTIVIGTSVLVVIVIAVGAWFLIQSASTKRETERRNVIETALQEASRLGANGQWDEAIVEGKRAEDLGYDGPVVSDIRAAAEAARAKGIRDAADDEFLSELAAIMDRRAPALPGADGLQSDTATDAAFAEAFNRRFGSLEGATKTLRESSSTEIWVGHLVFWRWLRRVKLGATDWEEIDTLIRRIDPDNGPLHDALVDGDATRLAAISESQAEDLPLALAAQVGIALAGEPGQERAAVEFLLAQSDRAPGDFRMHVRLAEVARMASDPRLSVQQAMAATALEPSRAMAWRLRGVALDELGEADGALFALGRAAELDPGNPWMLAWLRAGLSSLREQLADDPAGVIEIIERWTTSPDLAPVRDADDLSTGLQELWSDLGSLSRQAKEMSK